MYRLLSGYSGLIAGILSFIKWIDSAASCFITGRHTVYKTYLNMYTTMQLASLEAPLYQLTLFFRNFWPIFRRLAFLEDWLWVQECSMWPICRFHQIQTEWTHFSLWETNDKIFLSKRWEQTKYCNSVIMKRHG